MPGWRVAVAFMHVVRLLPIVRNFYVLRAQEQHIWEHWCAPMVEPMVERMRSVWHSTGGHAGWATGEVNRCGADRVDFNFTTRIPARTSYLLTHLVHQQQLTVICGADSLPQLTPRRPYDVRNRAAAHRKR